MLRCDEGLLLDTRNLFLHLELRLLERIRIHKIFETDTSRCLIRQFWSQSLGTPALATAPPPLRRKRSSSRGGRFLRYYGRNHN